MSLFAKLPHVLIEKTRLCQELGVKPQVAVYSDGDVDNADRYLIKTGLLEKPYYWIILAALPGGPSRNTLRPLLRAAKTTIVSRRRPTIRSTTRLYKSPIVISWGSC